MRTLALLAALLPGIAVALPDDAEQPIEVHAEEGVANTDGVAVLKGSVRLEQGSLLVLADRMTIERDADNRVRVIVGEGSPATFQQRLEADESPVTARANSIVYRPADEWVEFSGDVFLFQDDDEFHGERIRWDIREGRIDASAPESGEVKLILHPAKEPSATGAEPAADADRTARSPNGGGA
ncbi:MAG: lipopolysaccharide transport periplasmic protein LptA [Gammaproteobacteria bacterium]|nr:lipopolysaccharide transport periplasmic protein LptA [Gammaproteobacteria bacterium]